MPMAEVELGLIPEVSQEGEGLGDQGDEMINV